MRATFQPSRLLSLVRFLTSPFVLLVIYIGYLGAILIIHYVYYRQYGCEASICTREQTAACCYGADWFGAAILDNYAFIAILLYPLMITYLLSLDDCLPAIHRAA